MITRNVSNEYLEKLMLEMATLERDNGLLLEAKDAGKHTCRYEHPGQKPCKRCLAEAAYDDRDKYHSDTVVTTPGRSRVLGEVDCPGCGATLQIDHGEDPGSVGALLIPGFPTDGETG